MGAPKSRKVIFRSGEETLYETTVQMEHSLGGEREAVALLLSAHKQVHEENRQRPGDRPVCDNILIQTDEAGAMQCFTSEEIFGLLKKYTPQHSGAVVYSDADGPA